MGWPTTPYTTPWEQATRTWAARLVEQHVDELILRSEGATIARWLAALPANLASSRPRLCLARTFVAVADGDVDAAGPPLDAAERMYADAVDEPFEPSVGRAASLLVNLPAIIALERAALAHLRGDVEGTAASASRALAAIGEGEWMLDSVTRWHLAVAEWLRGRLPEAERAFASGIAQWRQAGELTLAAWGGHYLGQVQRARGRLDAALGTYQQTLEITAPPGRSALPASGVPQVGLAEVAYQRNELDTALAHVTEGIALCRRFAYTQPLATGLAAAGVDPAGPRRSGRGPGGDGRGRAGRAGPAVTSLLNPVPAQRARLLLAQGEVTAAARWTEERGLGPDDEPGYPREPEYLVLARVLLAQDRPGPALYAAGAAAHGGGRPGAYRQCHRDPGAAGPRAGRQRRRQRRGERPGPGAHPRACPRATCGSSPTRVRRWPPCSAA